MHRIGKASGGIGWEWLAVISTAFYWSKEDTNLIDIQEAANRLRLLLEVPCKDGVAKGMDIGRGRDIQSFFSQSIYPNKLKYKLLCC